MCLAKNDIIKTLILALFILISTTLQKILYISFY